MIRVPQLLSGVGMIILKRVRKLGDKVIYEEVSNNPGPLISTIHQASQKNSEKM